MGIFAVMSLFKGVDMTFNGLEDLGFECLLGTTYYGS